MYALARASAQRGVEMQEILPHSDVSDGIGLSGRAKNAVRRERSESPSVGADLKYYLPTDIGRATADAPEPKRALTVNEAVRLYSISRSSLYKLVGAGVIPDVVVSGRRLIPRDAMEALISGGSRDVQRTQDEGSKC
jgi:excisionase family DNA binding protein